MSTHHPPLTCAEFKAILSKLGFKARAMRSGTSHEDWVKDDGRFYKVTVDCPKAPFTQDLISSMAKQAGVTKQQIYDIHFERYQEEEPASAAVVVSRFEARAHEIVDGVQFWCVWDTQLDAFAYGGQLTFLTEQVAFERAALMNGAS